ncbi:MAG: hypothetical protein PF486_14680 [Prolixibacteraceae bacterium]|jgi:hypothetical protein|nr:hypothetical protein [Prolixibacteraceae bacterium]
MKRKKLISAGIIVVVVAGIIITGAIGFYMFNMPHRNVQSAKTDYQLTATALVAEYLENAGAANEKYLASDGDSKIMEVTGTVNKISENYAGKKVIILKGENDKAGVSCTFNGEVNVPSLGTTVTAKGEINAGASYDTDMELYQDVVLNNCTLVN